MGRVDSQVESFDVGHDVHLGYGATGGFGKVDGTEFEIVLAGVGAGEEQEIADQESGAFGLRVHVRPSGYVLFHGARPCLHEFGSGLDDGHWSAQFMGRIGGELSDAMKGGFETAQHLVENVG